MNGHSEGKKFIPHNNSKKGISSGALKSRQVDNETMKGLPKSFKGYDVMARKKVTVTKDIHKIRMKNGRPALQGRSPIKPNNIITHIVSE